MPAKGYTGSLNEIAFARNTSATNTGKLRCELLSSAKFDLA